MIWLVAIASVLGLSMVWGDVSDAVDEYRENRDSYDDLRQLARENGQETGRIAGGIGADQIDADEGDNLIAAWRGDDQVSAGAGDDTVYAGEGADRVYGADGNDTIYGQEGADTLHGGNGEDQITGGPGDDVVYFGVGDDNGAASKNSQSAHGGDDELFGGWGDDDLTDGFGSNSIYGGAGADMISGLDAQVDRSNPLEMNWSGDFLDGGTGNDKILADDDDTVTTGDGQDQVILDLSAAGSKNEVVTITDFDVKQDALTIEQHGSSVAASYELVSKGNGTEIRLDGVPRVVLQGITTEAQRAELLINLRAA